MQPHNIILFVVLLILTGCTVFEQTPEGVQNKLMNPGSGRLYEPDPLQTP